MKRITFLVVVFVTCTFAFDGLNLNHSFLHRSGKNTLKYSCQDSLKVIKGVMNNDTGAFVFDAATLWFTDENRDGFEVSVDSNGNFIAQVKEGTWTITLYGIDPEPVEINFMIPIVIVEIGDDDDTVTVRYMTYNTNSSISGTIINSAGINLDNDFSVDLHLDTTGQWDPSMQEGIWYVVISDIDSNNNTFKTPVNSKFLKYLLMPWAQNLPEGSVVDPELIDSVGPGQSDIQITITESTPVIHAPKANNFDLNMKYISGNIIFDSPTNGNAILSIYNLNGRMLKTLYNGIVSSRTYSVPFTADIFDFGSVNGCYIARITINGVNKYTKNIRLISVK